MDKDLSELVQEHLKENGSLKKDFLKSFAGLCIQTEASQQVLDAVEQVILASKINTVKLEDDDLASFFTDILSDFSLPLSSENESMEEFGARMMRENILMSLSDQVAGAISSMHFLAGKPSTIEARVEKKPGATFDDIGALERKIRQEKNPKISTEGAENSRAEVPAIEDSSIAVLVCAKLLQIFTENDFSLLKKSAILRVVARVVREKNACTSLRVHDQFHGSLEEYFYGVMPLVALEEDDCNIRSLLEPLFVILVHRADIRECVLEKSDKTSRYSDLLRSLCAKCTKFAEVHNVDKGHRAKEIHISVHHARELESFIKIMRNQHAKEMKSQRAT